MAQSLNRYFLYNYKQPKIVLTPRTYNSNADYKLFFIPLDGQAIAKRLSRRIDRVTKSAERLTSKYNSPDKTVPMMNDGLSCFPSSIEVSDVLNQQSDLWGRIDADISESPQTPLKRKAIELWHLRNRCIEEEQIVETEKSTTITGCNDRIAAVDNVLQTKLNDRNSSAGVVSLITKKGMSLLVLREYYLCSFGLSDENSADLGNLLEAADVYYMDADSDDEQESDIE